MRDVELYRHLLGIEQPWTVSRVELSVSDQRVDVWVGHAEGVRWACPECGTLLSAYDHAEERAWRHLDSCQFKTFLRAEIPRVRCPEHGVRQARVPWAEPHSRFTALFERLAIDVLREATVLGAGRILGLSWDEVWHIMERAVKRGLLAKRERIAKRIGVDEKAVGKGQQYFTLVVDLDSGTVEHVIDDRKQVSLDSFFKSRTEAQLQGIEAVAMDMWEPYLRSALAHLPGAADKVVFDRFHIMKHVNQAVDDVRKQENKELRATGDDSLTGSKYAWIYGRENLPEKYRERFASLKAMNLRTGRAWAIKESLRDLWSYVSPAWAEKYWKCWYFWATHSRLKPVIDKARMIQRHLGNVLTYFKHRITNAMSEGLNSTIQEIKHSARGFRNRENFKTSIYFHCGGLDLYPATHGNPR